MRCVVFAVILLFAHPNYAQIELTYPLIKEANKFRWQPEKKTSRLIIDQFIKDHPKDFKAYREKDSYVNIDSLKNDLHLLDINGDKKLDVLFDGRSGGEPREINIYINTGSSFKKVFSVWQGIVKMDWEGTLLKRIYIDDWGCCAEYQILHKIFDITYDKTNTPVFKQIYQSVSVSQGEIPSIILDKPFRFEVLNQGYKIRSEPVIDDTSARMWNTNQQEGKGDGNSLGKLTRGATGTALAKKVDITGREWLYVEIDEPFLPKNDIIFIENKLPTKIAGWISSRFIKPL